MHNDICTQYSRGDDNRRKGVVHHGDQIAALGALDYTEIGDWTRFEDPFRYWGGASALTLLDPALATVTLRLVPNVGEEVRARGVKLTALAFHLLGASLLALGPARSSFMTTRIRS